MSTCLNWLAACHDRKDRWIAWLPKWIIWLRLLRGEAVSVGTIVSTTASVKKSFTAVGIAVQLDFADFHVEARTPAPANVVGAWRELVALVLFLQFQIWLVDSWWVLTCHVRVVKCGDPGIRFAFFERKG